MLLDAWMSCVNILTKNLVWTAITAKWLATFLDFASEEMMLSKYMDGQKILAEFVVWESSGPTYTFNKLRDQLCEDAKFGFDVNTIYLFGFSLHAKSPKKIGFKKPLILKVSILLDTPK